MGDAQALLDQRRQPLFAEALAPRERPAVEACADKLCGQPRKAQLALSTAFCHEKRDQLNGRYAFGLPDAVPLSREGPRHHCKAVGEFFR